MLSGRTCLITGATRGIGLATAREIAKLGSHIAIVARDGAAGKRTAGEITAAVPGASVEWFAADLSLQRDVRRLSDELHARYPALNIFISNAAIVTPHRTMTVEGVETQFAVNHLAPFLLTHLVLDLLKGGAPARVVIVASQVERGGRINFDDLMGERHYSPLAAYSQTKLANVLFTYSLAARLAGTGVTANCLHPGVVRTRLLDTIGEIEEVEARPGNPVVAALRDSAQVVRSGLRRMLPLPRAEDWAIGPDEGAKTTVYVASSPALEDVSGKYFREMRESETSPQSHDTEVAEKLWEISARLTGI